MILKLHSLTCHAHLSLLLFEYETQWQLSHVAMIYHIHAAIF